MTAHGHTEPGEFVLPRHVGIRDTQSLFELCSRLRDWHEDITLDASLVEFVDPFGMAVLSALFDQLRDRRIRIDWLSVDVAGYLDRMNFFAHCPIEGVEVPARSRSDRRTSLVELSSVSDWKEVDNAAQRLAYAIAGELTDADPCESPDESSGRNGFEAYSYPLQYSLSELLENSLTHARREGRWNASVWVAAQYYKSNDVVRVAVVDNGCGILATLRLASSAKCQDASCSGACGLDAARQLQP